MSKTRPTGEQLRFVSSQSGEHVLDDYLEASEKGGRTLPDMLEDIFDPADGAMRTDIYQWRFNENTSQLQYRVGDFADPDAGWADVTSLLRPDTYSNAKTYNTLDLVILDNGDGYLVLANNQTFATETLFKNSPNTTKIIDVSLAKDWATKTSDTVDGSDYSAKYWATQGNVPIIASNISDINALAPVALSIPTLAAQATEVGQLAPQAANIAILAPKITEIETVADNVQDVNAFALRYKIQPTAPSGPTEGDLWWDETDNVLKAHNGTEWVVPASSNGVDLEDLEDVTVTSIANQHVLVWDGANNDWRNQLLSTSALTGTVNNSNWDGTALAVNNGGTGATTAGAARSNLGITATGDNIVTAASQAAARTALGLGTAATSNIGTVGSVIPKLDTANTWAEIQTMPSAVFTGAPTVNGQQVFHPGNDGPGSGMDADTLRGLTPSTAVIGGSLVQRTPDGDVYARDFFTDRGNGTGAIFFNAAATRHVYWNGTQYDMPGGPLVSNGGTVWTTVNDGSGSGLDADFWDGNQFASFINQPIRTSDSPRFASVIIGGSGAYQAGSIYSDTNYGMLFRARQSSPALNEFAWMNAAGTQIMQLTAALALLVNGHTVMTHGNDGSGSGFDADLWDGNQFGDYLNQGVKTTDSPNFAGLNLIGTYKDIQMTSGNSSGYIQGRYDTKAAADDALVFGVNFRRNTSGQAGFVAHGSLGTAEYGAHAPAGGTGFHTWSVGGTAQAPAEVARLTSGGFSTTGNITAYSSDRRLKKNVQPIKDPLQKIALLGGYTYDWDLALCQTEGFTPAQEHEHGVIAQEIEAVIPDGVAPAPFNSKYLTVRPERLIPLLIEGNKALQQKVDDLETRLAKLEAMMSQQAGDT